MPSSTRPRLVFVYSGLGSYWPGLAGDLLRDDALFSDRFREADSALAEHAGISVLDLLENNAPALPPGAEHALNFAFQIAMSARLRAWGITPDYFAGHSAGEVAAAVDAGVLTLSEGARLVAAHGRVLDGWGERCAAAFVALPHAAAVTAANAAGLGPDVVVAAVNDPGSALFSGPPELLDRLVSQITADGIFARRLPLFSPLHHPWLTPRLEKMRRSLAELRPAKPSKPFLSSWRGGASRSGDFGGDYWVAHVRDTNRFGAALQSLPAGNYAVIEIAPHPMLAESIRSCLRAAGISGTAVAVAKRNEPTAEVLRQMLWELRSAGVQLDWPTLADVMKESAAAESVRSSAVVPIDMSLWPAAARRELLTETVTEILRSLLPGQAGNIDADSGFLEAGLDSLGLTRLKAELERRAGVELGVEAFFRSPTPRQLADKILGLDAAQDVIRGTSQTLHDDGVAVIGMACRLPGGAENPAAYWRLLMSGRDAIVPVPPERWDSAGWYDPDPKSPGKTHTRAGGFLQCPVDGFDAEFFGMSAAEADALDPQQRLFLETAWEAFESAGIDPTSVRGARVGVFLGMSADDYAVIHRYADPRRLAGYSLTGSTGSTACGRVSFFFGLEGPCYVVDTACSSSLACIHLARRALLNGEIDMALAGGANVMLIPEIHVCFSKLGATSADGRCKTFDAGANGYGRGEGAGMVALKRFSDARRDSDPVLAVLRGSAVNSDGRSSSLTAPNGRAQEAVAREALAQAGWRPEDVAYVETHGTGTPLGDAVEATALGEVYGLARAEGRPALRIGSAKPVIGHLEAAAGVASFIKVALAVGKGLLPASIGCAEPNPAVEWGRLKVEVNREASPWPEGRRRAGISAFGIGGTNCHALLEDAGAETETNTETQAHPAAVAEKTELLTLSARTPQALRALCGVWAQALSDDNAPPLADAAHTSRAGRARFRRRIAVTGADRLRLAEVLARFADDEATGREAVPASPPAVVFLYPGQGAQRAGMGRELYRDFPAYREAFDRAAAAFADALPVPLAEAVFGESADETRLSGHLYAQAGMFAAGVAATALWRSWGVAPAAVAGHSVGEYAAACAAGALGLEDAARLVAERARSMERLPAGGGMTVARLTPEAARESFVRHGATALEVAAENGPESVTVSGPTETLAAWGAAMKNEGVAVTPLAVSGAFHSAAIEPVLQGLTELAGSIAYAEPKTEWWSTRRAERMTGCDFAGYWAEQTRGCVRFMDTVRAIASAGNILFVEMGPGATLCGLGRASCTEGLFLPGMGAAAREREGALRSLGALWERGVNPDPAGLNPLGRARRVAMPTYPFQRRRHWAAEARVFPGEFDATAVAASEPTSHPANNRQPYLGVALDGPGVAGNVWESVYTDLSPDFMPEHVIFGRAIAPAAAYVSLAISAGIERWGAERELELTDFEFNEPLIGDAAQPRRVRVVLDGDGNFTVASREAAEQNGAWTRHAGGRVRPVEESGGAALADAPALRLPSGDEVFTEGHDELYGVFLGNNYALGPNFRHIRSARIGRDTAECAVDCRPPESLRGLRVIHPGIMDSIIQTGMPAIGARRQGYLEGGSILIPMRIDRLVVRRLPAGEMRCVCSVRHAEGATVNSIDVLDDAGQRIMRVDGMLLRLVSRDALYSGARRRAGVFIEEWSEAVPPVDPARKNRVGGWIVAGACATATETLAAALRGADARNLHCVDTEKGRGPLAAELSGLAKTNNSADAPWRFVYVAGLAGSDSRAAEQTIGGAYVFFQALNDAGLLESGRLWLVRKTDDESLWAGALTGFGRSLRQEHPSAWGGIISAEDWQAPALCALLSTEPAPPDDEWRFAPDGSAFVPRIVQLPPPGRREAAENSSRAADKIRGGTHLVTGGAGALGRAFAGWLLGHGAARVVLCGRREEDAAVGTALDNLRAAAHSADGGTVEYRRCDVADADAVSKLIDGLADGPPLTGIFHAAGTLADGAAMEKDWPRVWTALAAKALGAWNLHAAATEFQSPLEFFVMCSSASALLGSAGQTAYAAANAALDHLARRRRQAGLPALAVQWGPWAGGGMAEGTGRGDRLARFGLDGMQPEDALASFTQALSAAGGDGVAAVMHVDWKAYFAQWLGGSRPARFGAVAPEEADDEPDADERGAGGLLALLAGGERENTSAAPDAVADWLDSAARRLLGRHEKLDPDQPLLEQGFDSLMAIEWRNLMAKELDRPIPSSFLFDYPTLASVAATLLAEFSGEKASDGEEKIAAAAATGTKNLLTELDELLGTS